MIKYRTKKMDVHRIRIMGKTSLMFFLNYTREAKKIQEGGLPKVSRCKPASVSVDGDFWCRAFAEKV